MGLRQFPPSSTPDASSSSATSRPTRSSPPSTSPTDTRSGGRRGATCPPGSPRRSSTPTTARESSSTAGITPAATISPPAGNAGASTAAGVVPRPLRSPATDSSSRPVPTAGSGHYVPSGSAPPGTSPRRSRHHQHPHRLARARQGDCMQTPILISDHLWACLDSGILSCVEARTGIIRYSERLPSGQGYTASPVSDGRHLYFPSEPGSVYVVPAVPNFSIVATNALGATCLASPAIADGALLSRTRTHLVAVGINPLHPPPAQAGHDRPTSPRPPHLRLRLRLRLRAPLPLTHPMHPGLFNLQGAERLRRHRFPAGPPRRRSPPLRRSRLASRRRPRLPPDVDHRRMDHPAPPAAAPARPAGLRPALREAIPRLASRRPLPLRSARVRRSP